MIETEILSYLFGFLITCFLMKQVCHRDLKLENTLLDDSPAPRLKICDFGYSKVIVIFHLPILFSYGQSIWPVLVYLPNFQTLIYVD